MVSSTSCVVPRGDRFAVLRELVASDREVVDHRTKKEVHFRTDRGTLEVEEHT